MSFFELSFVLLVKGLTVFFLCHGVVTFVLLRCRGSRFLEPDIELFTKSLTDVWHFNSEAVLFADVLAELVELIVTVLVIVDEFPITLADDRGGLTPLIAVVRVVPEQSAIGDLVTFQKRNEAEAIDMLFWYGG